MGLIIRFEELAGQQIVYNLLSSSFDSNDEEGLVRLLHTNHSQLISMVAELDGNIIGQIILSEMTVEGGSNLNIFGLAPMCVLPRYQHQGVGCALVRQVVMEAKRKKIDAIFVLGHPKYYPKFGFSQTDELNIFTEYDVPSEFFMVLDISKKLKNIENKTVRYAHEFKEII
jgi:putative acetyltransferase